MKASYIFTTMIIFSLSVIGKSSKGPPRPILPTLCERFYGGFVWQPVGSLKVMTVDDAMNGMTKTDYFSVPNWVQGSYTNKYTFTFSAHYPVNIGETLWIQAERAWGDGDGQQFLFTFYDKAQPPAFLDQFWVVPNTNCTAKSTFAYADIGGMDVQARDYED